ncbi:unnamed protein product [Rangifer tarandus platyrhynchus]|uniref:Uncharacterized protein n=1 Tax=Rangifer tarandus platyrhynchus TaxID=3082113 RepID=A0AC59YZW8_RANTA
MILIPVSWRFPAAPVITSSLCQARGKGLVISSGSVCCVRECIFPPPPSTGDCLLPIGAPQLGRTAACTVHLRTQVAWGMVSDVGPLRPRSTARLGWLQPPCFS